METGKKSEQTPLKGQPIKMLITGNFASSGLKLRLDKIVSILKIFAMHCWKRYLITLRLFEIQGKLSLGPSESDLTWLSPSCNFLSLIFNKRSSVGFRPELTVVISLKEGNPIKMTSHSQQSGP